ncbi:branched-chain amino acid transport system permease protein [Paraburkholderia bryophila]|uniref:Branched-chain amino acid transport system permease protein n=1 Tax=Paraburkholderia bryophila TaxID=420952 RepID=A0A7Y9WAY7_9BURK|nr:branched-chain amino acid transport system permease protein [Paraburkholderia bryophila]
MKRFEGKLGWTLLFALGLVFPFLASNDYMLTVMSTAYIFALATVGLNLITGYTGQFNLAHGSFMAVGAYTVGILTVDHQMPFWLAFVASGVVTGGLGVLVGLVSLRLRGHYFSIFTLCVGYIMFLVIEKWDSVTHGVADVIGIPAPSGFGLVSFENPRALYYLVFAFLVLGVWLMHRIVNSLLGRTFMAIRNSDGLAQSLGIDLMRNKVLAFVLSVVYAGFAGGLYAGSVRFLGAGPGRRRTYLRHDHVHAGGRHRHARRSAARRARHSVAYAIPAVSAGIPLRGVRPDPDSAGDLSAQWVRRFVSGNTSAARGAFAGHAFAASIANRAR